jgi:predicted nucleic acid-binding protein
LPTAYSEDMQHGQMIEDRLQIFNPFLEAATS